MEKRGQVTIFVIIAILVIALIALFFIFRNKIGTEENSVETDPVYVKTLSCLESTTEEGVKYISLRGGYYNIPEEISASYLTEEAPYYYINSKKDIPSMERIESELENYTIENLRVCVNFENLKEQGFEITEGNLSVSVNINENYISVEADYPLTIKKGEYTSRFREFKSKIDYSIEELYLASEEIVNEYYKRPGFVCLTCIEDISSRYNVESVTTPISDEDIWFSIFDKETELTWRFVVEQ